MVREELVAALRNALDRGENIQRAMQTLISSGYDSAEVQEASRYANTSILHDVIKPDKTQIDNTNNRQELKIMDSGYKQLPTIGVQAQQEQSKMPQLPTPQSQNPSQIQVPQQGQQQMQQNPQQIEQENQVQTKKKRVPAIFIVLMIIVAMLIIGLVAFIAFGEQILAAFFGKG